METVAVIGGTGFIGDYLVQNLNRKKNIRILVIYKDTPPVRRLPNAQYFQVNGAQNPKKLFEIIKSADYLILLARPNFKLINNIIQSELAFKKIIYTSTILIYPNSSKKQNEKSKLKPANDYEKNKIKEEKLLSEYAENTGNPLTIARLTNVYGNVKNRGVIHWILSALIAKQPFVVNNSGEPVRDFIFVEDVAKYLELLINFSQKEKIEVFNVCTGIGFSLNQLIAEVELITNKKLKTKTGNTTEEKNSIIGDNKKIIRATGYEPKFDIRSGLSKAYQNYLKN